MIKMEREKKFVNEIKKKKWDHCKRKKKDTKSVVRTKIENNAN